MQQNWSVQLGHILVHHFLLDSKSLTQESTKPSSYNDTCSANLADTALVPQTSTIIDNQSNHHISYAKSTAKCTKKGSCISGKQNIKVSGLESFRESFIDSAYQSRLPVLSPMLEGQVQTQITTCPGKNGIVAVLEKKSIWFSVL